MDVKRYSQTLLQSQGARSQYFSCLLLRIQDPWCENNIVSKRHPYVEQRRGLSATSPRNGLSGVDIPRTMSAIRVEAEDKFECGKSAEGTTYFPRQPIPIETVNNMIMTPLASPTPSAMVPDCLTTAAQQMTDDQSLAKGQRVQIAGVVRW